MLFILIAIAWLAIVTIVVAACRMAARADTSSAARASEKRGRRSPRGEIPFPELTQFPGLTISGPRDPIRQQRLSVLTAGRTGRARGSAATARRHPPRVGSLAGRGARARGERHA
jgi:hypothetical protein